MSSVTPGVTRRKLLNEFSDTNGGTAGAGEELNLSQVLVNGSRPEGENSFNSIELGISSNENRLQKATNVQNAEYLRSQCESFKVKPLQLPAQEGDLTSSDRSTKILVVAQCNGDYIAKKIRNMKLLRKVEIIGCSTEDMLHLCNQEKYLLVLLELNPNVYKESCRNVWTTLRLDNDSPNRTVPIIALVPEGASRDIAIPEAANDTIQLPLTEDVVNQQLLKWAGKTFCNDCPEDDVALAKKAAQIIKETEEQSLLNSQQSASDRPTHYEHKQPFISATSESRTQGEEIITVAQGSSLSHDTHSPYTYFNQPPKGFFVKSCPTASNTKTRDRCGEFSPHQPTWNRRTTDQHGTFSQGFQEPRVIGIRPSQERVVIQGVPNQEYSEPTVQQFSGHMQSVSNQCFKPQSAPLNVMHHSQQLHIQSQHVITQNPYAPQHQHVLPANQNVLPRNQHLRPQPNAAYLPSYSTGNPHYKSVVPCWPRFPTPPPETRIATQSETLDSWAMSPQSCESFPGSSSLQSPVSALGSPAYMVSGTPGSKEMKITLLHDDLTKHSSKERLRRERIKDSCDQLRLLLPCLSGTKTDMASILEMTVKYVRLINQRIPAALKLEIANTFCPDRKLPRKKRASQPYEPMTAKKRLYSTGESPQGQTVQMRSIFPNDNHSPFALKTSTVVSMAGPSYPHQALYGGCSVAAAGTHVGSQCGQPIPRDNPATSSFEPSTRIMANQSNERSTIFYPQMHVQQENANTMPPVSLHCTSNQISTGVVTHQRQAFDAAGKQSDEMPTQWGFLRLPPISTISPASSTSNLSPGDSISDIASSSTCSGRTTPDNTVATPPPTCSIGNGKHVTPDRGGSRAPVEGQPNR